MKQNYDDKLTREPISNVHTKYRFLKRIALARPVNTLILGIKLPYPFLLFFFYKDSIFSINFFQCRNGHVTDIMIFGVKMMEKNTVVKI